MNAIASDTALPASGAAPADSANAETPAPSRQEQVAQRRGWLERVYLTSLNVTLVMGAALLLSLSVNVYVFLNPPLPQYFASTQDGRLIEVFPTNQPYLRDTEVTAWAGKVVQSALNLDFVHWREQLSAAEVFFSEKGFEDFITAIQDAGLKESMVQRQLVFSVALQSAPVVVAKGLDRDGIYKWDVQAPVLITAENSESNYSMSSTIELRFIRIPTTKHSKGLAVQQFIMGTN